jgi:hypothetical protein
MTSAFAPAKPMALPLILSFPFFIAFDQPVC